MEQAEHRAREAQETAATLEAMVEADSSTAREYRADIDAATAAAATMDGELSRLHTRMLHARQQATDAATAVEQVRAPSLHCPVLYVQKSYSLLYVHLASLPERPTVDR